MARSLKRQRTVRLRTAAFIFVAMIVVFSCLYIRLLFRVEKLTSETSAKKEFDNGVRRSYLKNCFSGNIFCDSNQRYLCY